MPTATTAPKYASVNGIELGYQVFGKGDPLILLHGGFGSVEMFGPNVDLLAAGQRVIGVDLQSHGRTPVANRPMRFETMADDVAALIRELGLPRAAVMGFSLGGGVALRTAMEGLWHARPARLAHRHALLAGLEHSVEWHRRHPGPSDQKRIAQYPELVKPASSRLLAPTRWPGGAAKSPRPSVHSPVSRTPRP